jgi:hypothetical protein
VRGQAHQGSQAEAGSRQGRRVSCSQVDGMQASVVGVCLQKAESAKSLATSRRKRGVYTTCLPRLKLQRAHNNGQRQRLTHSQTRGPSLMLVDYRLGYLKRISNTRTAALHRSAGSLLRTVRLCRQPRTNSGTLRHQR